MISTKVSGSFENTNKFLAYLQNREMFNSLEGYGRKGVDALENATPTDTGLTARSWRYKIIKDRGRYTIEWYNTNIQNGSNIAILIQYGHGTGTGGWVQGRDYINPAIQPVFDQIANEVWEKVKRA